MKHEWSDEVLEEIAVRLTKFLAGMGAEPAVHLALVRAGMTADDIAEGRTLLLGCLVDPTSVVAATDTPSARQQRAAVASLDAWDEPNFARYRAALARHAPAVGAALFAGLQAATGSLAVQSVATLLLRLDALDHAARGAKATKATASVRTTAALFAGIPAKDCKAAAALLAQRGLDAAARESLLALVQTALRPTAPLAAGPAADEERRSKRREAQRAARSWYEEWAACARAVVKNRAHLIRLGLAKRKSPAKRAKLPTAATAPVRAK